MFPFAVVDCVVAAAAVEVVAWEIPKFGSVSHSHQAA